jgi:hypothetical protein
MLDFMIPQIKQAGTIARLLFASRPAQPGGRQRSKLPLYVLGNLLYIGKKYVKNGEGV